MHGSLPPDKPVQPSIFVFRWQVKWNRVQVSQNTSKRSSTHPGDTAASQFPACRFTFFRAASFNTRRTAPDRSTGMAFSPFHKREFYISQLLTGPVCVTISANFTQFGFGCVISWRMATQAESCISCPRPHSHHSFVRIQYKEFLLIRAVALWLQRSRIKLVQNHG